MTQGRYAHLRQCYYSFDNGTDDFERFDVIQNGCSANQPITVLNQTRQSMSYDVFGQVMFMHQDFDTTKVRISCIVDACLPPTLGKQMSPNVCQMSPNVWPMSTEGEM